MDNISFDDIHSLFLYFIDLYNDNKQQLTAINLSNMKKALFTLFLITFVCCGKIYSQNTRTVSVLGDSYSTFNGFIPEGNACWYSENPDRNVTDVDAVNQTWWYKLINENGLRLEKNNSYSGSTICNTGYNKKDYSDRSFITRMKDLGSPDIILICGATNDSWANSPIGDYVYQDWTEEALYNFRPAMSYLLSNMKDHYKDAEIFFILNDSLKPEINESVKKICSYYDVQLIELSMIHKLSGHPSVEGMSQICEQVKNYLGK